MLYIYRTKALTNDILAIYDVEEAFMTLNPILLDHLYTDDEVSRIIKEIDGSRHENGVLHTRFGIVPIQNCSSGCKAALLTYLCSLNEFTSMYGVCYVDVSETGDNAIRVINKMSVDRDIYIHCTRAIPLNNEHGNIIFEGKEVTQNQMVGVMHSDHY